MLTLFQYLPIILSDVIRNADCNKLLLFQLLHEVVELVMLPVIMPSHLHHLEDLIAHHHNLFTLCYPEKRLLYKHHSMIHYCTVMRQSGPLLRMTVMRFEAKHNCFKKLAHVTCNFKNISYTAAHRHQLYHAYQWMNTSPLKAQVELENGEMVQVSEQGSYSVLEFQYVLELYWNFKKYWNYCLYWKSTGK
jgi:hypothetical protein